MSSNYPTWDPKLLNLENTDIAMAIVGSRFQGKSTFLEWLWKNVLKQHFDIIIVFTDNPQAEAYDFFTEKERRFVFPRFEDQIIKDLDYFQFSTDNVLRIGWVFDDCSMHNKQNGMLQQLFIRGRNINSSLFFSTQYHLNLSTAARANIDWLVVFGIHGTETKRKMVNTFLWDVVEPKMDGKVVSMKKRDREDFVINWLHTRTEDHNMILVDQRNRNQIYQFKTPYHKLKKENRKAEKEKTEKEKNSTN